MKTRIEISFLLGRGGHDFVNWKFVYEHGHHANSPKRLFQLCMMTPPDTKFEGTFHSLSFLPDSFQGQDKSEAPIKFGKVAFPVVLKGVETSIFSDDMEINLQIDSNDFTSDTAVGIVNKMLLLKFVWCSVIHSHAILLLVARDPVTAALQKEHSNAVTGIGVGGLGWELISVANNMRATPEEALQFWESILNFLGKQYWKVN